ncbi:MAG: DUF1573 domain-containing protein [Bacteroidales bacterium]|nr:DUF1573 domain-containing protein [Bacteroidales bacterium]
MNKTILFSFFGSALLILASCQKTPTPELTLSQHDYSVESTGGNLSVNVSSNVDVTVHISADWITQTGKPSVPGGTYSFSVSHNDTYDSRKATITFSNSASGVSETINVIQDQQDAIIPGNLEYELFYPAQTFTLPVSSNVEITVSTQASWLKSQGTRGLSSKNFSFSVEENTAKEPREARIEISSGALRQTIKVVQLPTDHFPESNQEWDQSIATSEDIYSALDRITGTFGDGEIDTLVIREELSKLPDVVAVDCFESSVSVMQRDSVWLNYELYAPESPMFSSEDVTRSDLETRSRIGTRANVSGGKAYIYAPFQHSFKKPLDRWKKALLENFGEVTVRKKDSEKDDAGIWSLIEDLSTHYDFLVFDTHGTEGHSLKVEGNPFSSQLGLHPSIILCTSTPYTTENVNKLVKAGISKDQIAQDKPKDEPYSYICFTTKFINNYRFDNSCVILSACESAKRMDYTAKDDKGSMIGAFINRGASIVTGSKVTTKVEMLYAMVTHLIETMSLGCSFRDAFKHVARGDKIAAWRDAAYAYDSSDPFEYFDIPNQYICEKAKEDSDLFFFVSPYPELNEVVQKNGTANFSWKSNLTLLPITLYWETGVDSNDKKIYKPYLYTLQYDVYVDGKRLAKSISGNPSDTKTSWKPSSLGDHTWYVNAIIKQGDETIASYQSQVGRFTVTEMTKYEVPEAIDLGLSVKWASFNLGATKKEEYGYYYAWGETEPKDSYYWDTYKWCRGSNNSLTKYNVNSANGYNGFVDGKLIMEKEDDAAYVNLGNNWRMPTRDEWKELKDNCTWTWTTEFGEGGYKATSKKNGKFIFFPAGGYYNGKGSTDRGTAGYYWASNIAFGAIPDVTGCYSVYTPVFHENSITWTRLNRRYMGESIRPVYPRSASQVVIDRTSFEGYVGGQLVLYLSTVPENASHTFICSSSNESVATIPLYTQDICIVDLLSPGIATIKIASYDGEAEATCRVTVKESRPAISASPTSINYGDVKVGYKIGNEKGRVTFTNTGGDDLSIEAIECPDCFSFSSTYTFPIVIPPGSNKTIVFAFKPAEAKTYSGYVQVYSNASNGTCKIHLSGRGVE